MRNRPAGGFSHNDNISLKKFMTPVDDDLQQEYGP